MQVVKVVGSMLLVLAANVQAVRACEPARACASVATVYPEDGAQLVPTNVELRIQYLSMEASGHPVVPAELFDTLSGDEVPVGWKVEGELLRGTPEHPLSAGRMYALRHRLAPCSTTDAGSGTCGLCEDEAGTLVSSFSVSGVHDTDAPTSSLAKDPTLVAMADVGASSQCGPYKRCDYRIESEHDLGVRYRIFQGTDIVGEFVPPVDIAVYEQSGRTGGSDPNITQVGQSTYKVYAVDGAGNMSAPWIVVVPECKIAGGIAPVMSDAGASGFEDAGDLSRVDAGAIDAAGRRTSDDGCSVAVGAGDGGMLLLLTGLLVSFLWHRRATLTNQIS